MSANKCIVTIPLDVKTSTNTSAPYDEDCQRCRECNSEPYDPNNPFPSSPTYNTQAKGKKECKDIEKKIEIIYMSIDLCDECAKWKYGFYSYSQTTKECGLCDAEPECPHGGYPSEDC